MWVQGFYHPFLVRVSWCALVLPEYLPFSFYGFQLRDCASGYGSVWSRLWEISGHDRNAHVPYRVGIPLDSCGLKAY